MDVLEFAANIASVCTFVLLAAACIWEWRPRKTHRLPDVSTGFGSPVSPLDEFFARLTSHER